MKTINLLLPCAALIMGMSFSSCTKDDRLAAAVNSNQPSGLASAKIDLNTPVNSLDKFDVAGEGSGVPANWKTIETTTFIVEVPANWVFIDLSGFSTYNGIFTDMKDSLNFEYGIAHNNFEIDPQRFRYTYEVINGKAAKVIRGLFPPYQVGVAIDSANVKIVSDNPVSYAVRSFIMMQSSSSQMNSDVALRIIRSVRFKN